MNRGAQARKRGKSATVIGCGNIGSYLVPHLARIPWIEKLVLIDMDVYEEKNVNGQDIDRRDVGKPKVVVQAARARRIRPGMDIEVLYDDIEALPLGLFRSDVIATCLDSLSSRQVASEYAWRLGIPLIDAGVNAANNLVRVSIFVPGPTSACIECSWSKAHYDNIDLVNACAEKSGGVNSRSDVPPTNAASSLGAVAASFQAMECERLLGDDSYRAGAAGTQVVLYTTSYESSPVMLRCNPNCAFDHGTWVIDKVKRGPKDLSLHDLLKLHRRRNGVGQGPVLLGDDRTSLVRTLVCPGCTARRACLRLESRLHPAQLKCAGCGGPMVPFSPDTASAIDLAAQAKPVLRRPLASLGYRAHDVVTLADDTTEWHYEIGCP